MANRVLQLPLVEAGAVVEFNSIGELPANPADSALAMVAGVLYRAYGGTWASVGSGVGAVDSVNGFTGVVSLTTADIPEAGGFLYFTDERVDDRVAALIQNSANLTWTYDDGANTLTGLVKGSYSGPGFWSHADQSLIGLSGWDYFDNTHGLNVSLDQVADNTGGYTVQNYGIHIRPSLASPTSQFTHFNVQNNIDPDSSGFDYGTGGNALTIFNAGASHQGTSNTGGLTVFNSYSNIGNGTDAIDVKGYQGFFVYADINNNVNLSQGLIGYNFAPHIHASATFSTGGASTNVFSDNANSEAITDGWVSFNASPTLAGIHNNVNYTGLNVNPQVGVLQGNANFTGIYNGGQITTLGTGGFTGYQSNAQIANLSQNSRGMSLGGTVTTGTAEWVGLDIYMGGINTTGNVYGLRVTGTPGLTSNYIALEVDGFGRMNSNLVLTSGLGQAYNNVIGGSVTLPNSTAITGTDVIGNNMAIGIDTGNAGSTWTAASLVGITTLGFVGQIIGAGTLTGTVNFCLNGFADAHTGHIDEVRNFFAAAIPTGAGGTMDRHIQYYGDMSVGAIATDEWGIRIDDSANIGIENSLTRLAIGTSTKKVSNSSVGLELGSTTSAFLMSRQTSAQETALTAIDGMLLYNSTRNQARLRKNSTWSNVYAPQHELITASNGGSYTATKEINILMPNAATVAAFTLVLPASPENGFLITVTNGSETNAITALTLDPGTNSINNELTSLAVTDRAQFIFNASDTTWYRVL